MPPTSTNWGGVKEQQVRELVDDLDRLLGVDGDFWSALREPRAGLDTSDRLEELMRDLLVDFFGLEVQGL